MGGDGILRENVGRWNMKANVLFLESPPGVGFSYDSSISPPLLANDTSTTADSLSALMDFYGTFPLSQSVGLFLSGESYAGIYVPWLARAVLASSSLPLRGILVGNGALKTNDVYEGNLTMQRAQHAYNHGLFSAPLKHSIDAACVNWTAPRSSACETLLSEMANQIGPLNSYDIEVTCAPGQQQRALLGSVSHQAAPPSSTHASSVNVCSAADLALTAYMNQPDVLEALHVAPGKASLGPWAECADGTLSYFREPCDEMTDVYPGLLEKLQVLIYNGDQDECIPYLQDAAWTRDMGFPVKTDWRPWILDNQVAGYVTEFETPTRFTFATVKQAGHEVPMYQPERALAMVQRFIAGESL